MGINVTVSIGSSDHAGLACRAPIRPWPLRIQRGIFRALACKRIGTSCGVKGCAASGPGLRVNLNELAGDFSSNTSP